MPARRLKKSNRRRNGTKKPAARKRAVSQSRKLKSTARKPPRQTPAEKSAETASLPEFMIVGIGASAGGLQALRELLRELPRNLNMAIVCVQHLAPDHESILPALLSESASMPVAQVTDGVMIEPGHVYVIPPNMHMQIDAGRLTLTRRETGQLKFMPIDHFFGSLAACAQHRAIGIVLSGNASDGALGLQEIKGAGGITMVQSPESAKFDGMPRAAIATGAADLILDVNHIAAELARIHEHPLVQAPPAPPAEEALLLNDGHLHRIFSMLRAASGVDFRNYKLPTIKRRLQRRMVLHKLGNIDEYIKLLLERPAEVELLFQDILIHVTRFFREAESFEALRQHVLPKLVGSRDSDRPIRVWIPGCSTGEEPYSLGMLLLEYLQEREMSVPVQIFATDISELAIDRARAGVYPDSIVHDVSHDRLRRFFSQVDGGYRINKAVRDLCIFARQDVTRDPPFSKLDLILCRNVLIYLGQPQQAKLMRTYHYSLKSTGYLMLGSAETVGALADLFTVVDKKHKIYAKRPIDLPHHVDFDVALMSAHPGHPVPNAPREVRSANPLLQQANQLILDRYAPPGVLVDGDLQIVQFRGQTGRYLEPSPGEASLKLLKMAREGLLSGLRSALQEAKSSDKPVERRGLHVNHNGGAREVDLEVVPIGSRQQRHYLVLFKEVGAEPRRGETAKSRPVRGGKTAKNPGKPATQQARRIQSLENELAATREYLQSIIHDLEAANEELQSANEEILSSNEELQSTNEELDTAKEELQSTNEEINTVNDELRGRNEELSRVNDDLVNLLASVQIAIVMVDGNLLIRRFTPMAERVLNLISTDIGRPIGHIKPNIDLPDLEELIHSAIDNVNVIERVMGHKQDRQFMLRIRPYKTLDNRIDGAVLTLYDMESALTVRGDGEIPTQTPPHDSAQNN